MIFKPNPKLDQFLLTDENIITATVVQADLGQNDTVLEVGAGTGNLTRALAAQAGRVIAFEIDPQFKPFLNNLPKNVEIHFENAWDYIQLHGKFKKKKEYNKIVSNLPYTFAEQFLHNLTFLDYDKVILLLPIKMVNKIEKSGIFSSFFTPKIIFEVPKEKFDPIPRTNSVLIELIKLPDPLQTHNLGLFLRQYIYQHEDQLVKNSLVEGLIKFYGWTKNIAKKFVIESGISQTLLSKKPDNFEIYEEISKHITTKV